MLFGLESRDWWEIVDSDFGTRETVGLGLEQNRPAPSKESYTGCSCPVNSRGRPILTDLYCITAGISVFWRFWVYDECPDNFLVFKLQANTLGASARDMT